MVSARHALLFAGLLSSAMPAPADMVRSIAPPPGASAGMVSAGSLLQVGLSLLLVLAAIAAVAWAAKRLNPAQTGSGGPGSALRVISATAVGQRERVVLVEVGATWLVVGVAPGQVSSHAQAGHRAGKQ
jgi:flagellar protein FliO/FliZ